MSQVLAGRLDDGSDVLYLHFDVQNHHLKLETFIETADSARKIVATINEGFFHNSLHYELVVLPPDEGSFLTRLAIIFSAPAAVFTFVNTDVGAAFIDGLTGKPPVEWAKQMGQTTGETAGKLYEALTREEKQESKAACQVSANMVVAMTRGVLEKETLELRKIGMEAGTLTDALHARADFYTACINDKAVNRVGFQPLDDFPIPRSSFAERAQRPPRKADEEEPPDWTVSIENIYVTSPNWDVADQRLRHWKGKDQARRDCYFVIDDLEFWSLVKKKNLRVDVLDNLQVQWACQIVDGRAKNRRVIRVLEYNGNKLAEPLPAEALDAILGRHATAKALREEPSLFDGLE
ncbi:hypothetical protein [Rhizobium leguminosarum]|uniref:hypothetical protein n=1 Tax=Rhizobium leguminosarum TaxID=384 RepID=UPI001C97CAB4|nr:hypothetical protein [Rhizobium leguminosarum]MBY5516175.1 hypothetical protein [Rhizobium leguminosarum]